MNREETEQWMRTVYELPEAEEEHGGGCGCRYAGCWMLEERWPDGGEVEVGVDFRLGMTEVSLNLIHATMGSQTGEFYSVTVKCILN